jgi:hypothetical protein
MVLSGRAVAGRHRKKMNDGADRQKSQIAELLALAGGIEFIYWLDLIGKGRTTGYLWRQEGANGEPPRIKTVNIDGRLYARAEAIKDFWDRAERGEFAKSPTVPQRKPRKKRNSNAVNAGSNGEPPA